MKYTIIKTAAIATLVVAAFSSCSSSAHIEKANGIDFNNYKTFRWAQLNNKQNSKIQVNDIVDNNVKNEVSTRLIKKGFIKVVGDANADIIVNYKINTPSNNKMNRPSVTPRVGLGVGIGGGYGIVRPSFGMGVGGRQSYRPQATSTIELDMFDAKTNKLIWQGWTLRDGNGMLTSKEAVSEIKTILKKFNTQS